MLLCIFLENFSPCHTGFSIFEKSQYPSPQPFTGSWLAVTSSQHSLGSHWGECSIGGGWRLEEEQQAVVRYEQILGGQTSLLCSVCPLSFQKLFINL